MVIHWSKNIHLQKKVSQVQKQLAKLPWVQAIISILIPQALDQISGLKWTLNLRKVLLLNTLKLHTFWHQRLEMTFIPPITQLRKINKAWLGDLSFLSPPAK